MWRNLWPLFYRQDAVTTIVEKLVSLDLLYDTAKLLDKMVVATFCQRWFGDQLLSNIVIVKQGLNGEGLGYTT